jgi:hypothetical protein
MAGRIVVEYDFFSAKNKKGAPEIAPYRLKF